MKSLISCQNPLVTLFRELVSAFCLPAVPSVNLRTMNVPWRKSTNESEGKLEQKL
jgi:hypothetical protein